MGDSAHTTHHTAGTNPEKKISTPPFFLFFEDENTFQKSATMVLSGIAIEFVSSWPIFEKCSHLREKGGC
jgi:hypothetical protein